MQQHTQHTLIGAALLLRFCHNAGMPLAGVVEHWRRVGSPASLRSVLLARRAIREAAVWLGLPAERDWQRFEWQASAGVALIAVEVQMRQINGQAPAPAPPVLRLLPALAAEGEEAAAVRRRIGEAR